MSKFSESVGEVWDEVISLRSRPEDGLRPPDALERYAQSSAQAMAAIASATAAADRASVIHEARELSVKGPFIPNPGGQTTFLSDYSSRWCAGQGGFRAGKSVVASRKFAIIHILNAFDAKGQPTFVKSLMVALSYSLASSTNVPQIQAALEEFGIAYHYHADPQNKRFVLPELGTLKNPSQILIRSAEVPKAIAAFEVGQCWGDEVARWYVNRESPEGDAFIQADARISDKRARIVQFNATTTEEGEDTRYHEFFSVADGRRKIHVMPTMENARHLEPDYVESKKNMLTAELFDQYIMGVARPGGRTKIYYAYGPHNLDSVSLTQSLPLCLALDFNVNPGSYAELFHFDQHKGIAYVVREFFARGGGARQIAETVARELVQLSAPLPAINATNWKFPGILNLFGDASGGNRNLADARMTSWSEVLESFRQAGIPVTLNHIPEANPRVADRCAALNCALRAMDGTVRLKINGDACPGLLADFKEMAWEKGREDKSDTERSHPSSALGYAVHQLMPIR